MAVATAIGAEAITPDNGGGEAVPTWPADTPDDEDADGDQFMAGMLSIAVTPEGGTALEFRTEAMEDDEDTDEDESMTMPKTATKIRGLSGFTHGYSITDDGTHAIVFTDKQQGTPEVEEVTAATAKELTNFVLVADAGTVGKLGTKSGNRYTGVEFTPTGDTAPLTGTLTCGAEASCSVETDGDTITVTGYTFTGSREAREAVDAAEPAENLDYLAFGVWLTEDGDTGTDGAQPTFGAFADGGANSTTPEALHGKATYRGAATGVYTEGDSVDYFQGRATLTANFGDTPDEGDTDTTEGTVTGKIEQIMAGGVRMSDVINLNTDGDPANGNIETNGSFAGNARMGAAMVDGDVVTYTYNGMWGGQFYGPAEDDPATEDVTEAPANTAPGSVAGTFGVSGMTGEGAAAVTRSYVGAFGAHKD